MSGGLERHRILVSSPHLPQHWEWYCHSHQWTHNCTSHRSSCVADTFRIAWWTMLSFLEEPLYYFVAVPFYISSCDVQWSSWDFENSRLKASFFLFTVPCSSKTAGFSSGVQRLFSSPVSYNFHSWFRSVICFVVFCKRNYNFLLACIKDMQSMHFTYKL